jgi:hypothetical protein
VPDCIMAKKTTQYARGGGFLERKIEDPTTREELRSSNFWHARDADMARRIGNAMNVLIEDAGGKKSSF